MALSAVIVAALGRVAAADPRVELDRATAALDELRYRDAIRVLDAAWRAGGSTPAELRQIFALAGTAAGSTGDAAMAQTWYSRWLCLEPAARLPAGSSPKLVVLLDAARRELAGRALAGHAVRRAGGTAVIVDDDPLALVAAVRAGPAQRPVAGGEVQLGASPGPIALVDRYGNVLVELASDDALPGPPAASGAPRLAPPAGHPAGPAWYARWPVWAAVAVGTAVVGGVALHAAANADARLDDLAQHSADHEYSEARAQEQTLARAQWTARLAFGVALASATFAVVCHVRGRAVRTTLVPSGDGAGVGMAVAWSVRY